jgi:cytochrome c
MGWGLGALLALRRGGFAGLVVGALMVGVVGRAHAAGEPAGMSVAKANACLGCHAIDRKLVGPAFRDIAAKYKGDAQAQARLERKVRDGGSGVWGVIPMPAHPRMSAGDIRDVVGWVLAGAPAAAK